MLTDRAYEGDETRQLVLDFPYDLQRCSFQSIEFHVLSEGRRRLFNESTGLIQR